MPTLGPQFGHHDPVSQGKPEQLKMFMTPREILHHYQPLDADLYGAGTMGMSGQASSGTPTGTARTWGSHGQPGNVRHGQYRHGVDTKGTYQATTYGTKYRAAGETHEEMMGRKLEESQYEVDVRRRTKVGTSFYGSDSYVPDTRPSAGHESLYESIEKHGVEHPISLGTSGSHGSAGKREIVGGHHRLAAAEHINPDQFLPVAHYRDIYAARHDPTRKYT
jgi:hypothetical protein